MQKSATTIPRFPQVRHPFILKLLAYNTLPGAIVAEYRSDDGDDLPHLQKRDNCTEEASF